MKFDKARNFVKLLLAMCIVFGIVSIATNGTDSVMVVYAPILSLLFFVLTFVVIFLYCKCPNCGKTLFKRRGGITVCLDEKCGFEKKTERKSRKKKTDTEATDEE